MISDLIIYVYVSLQCALKMTKEDGYVDSDAEKITSDMFERYDKIKNNSLTKQEFEESKRHVLVCWVCVDFAFFLRFFY
jgi:hypothetical protein